MDGMTLRELDAEIRNALKNNPGLADVPVQMYSDEEGNDCHYVMDVAVAVNNPQEPPYAVVLVPAHGSVEGWW